MKVSIIWNVWNNYEDLLLGSEIASYQNKKALYFEELMLFGQGGFHEPPSSVDTQYLEAFYNIDYPESPLISLHTKFKGALRVVKGIQNAYRYAFDRNHDYAIVTNADAWYLSLEKLKTLLKNDNIANSCISARIGLATGFHINWGSAVPLFDDHFIILNIKKCTEYNVFDYADTARHYSPHFGHIGGIHNILTCFAEQRIPRNQFYIYTYLQDALGQYGDYCGWCVLPWQYQPTFGFLHANCAQIPSLNNLRAAFLHHLNLTELPNINAYYKRIKPDYTKMTIKNGVVVNKRSKKRLINDGIARLIVQIASEYHRRKYLKTAYNIPFYKDTLCYYNLLKNTIGFNLLG